MTGLLSTYSSAWQSSTVSWQAVNIIRRAITLARTISISYFTSQTPTSTTHALGNHHIKLCPDKGMAQYRQTIYTDVCVNISPCTYVPHISTLLHITYNGGEMNLVVSNISLPHLHKHSLTHDLTLAITQCTA